MRGSAYVAGVKAMSERGRPPPLGGARGPHRLCQAAEMPDAARRPRRLRLQHPDSEPEARR
eukprot:12906303-Prorocentrum_lima.AAC.1